MVEVVESVDGAPLSVGRKQRTIPTHLRRALRVRDCGCAFPGCHHTRFVDAQNAGAASRSNGINCGRADPSAGITLRA